MDYSEASLGCAPLQQDPAGRQISEGTVQTRIIAYHPEMESDERQYHHFDNGRNGSGPEHLGAALSIGGILVVDRNESSNEEWVVKHISRIHLKDDLMVTSFRYSLEFSLMKVRIMWPSPRRGPYLIGNGGTLEVLMAVPTSLKRFMDCIFADPHLHRRYIWTDSIGVTFLRDVCKVDEKMLWNTMASMYLRYVTVPSINYYDEPDYFTRLWMFQEFSYGRMLLQPRKGSDQANIIAALRGVELVHGTRPQLLGFNRAMFNPATLVPTIADHICLCIVTKGYTDIRDLETACFGVLAKAMGRQLPSLSWIIQGEYTGRDEMRERLLQEITDWVNRSSHLSSHLFTTGRHTGLGDAIIGQAVKRVSPPSHEDPPGNMDSRSIPHPYSNPNSTQRSVHFGPYQNTYLRQTHRITYGFGPLESNDLAELELKAEMAEWQAELSGSWVHNLQLIVAWAKKSCFLFRNLTKERFDSAFSGLCALVDALSMSLELLNSVLHLVGIMSLVEETSDHERQMNEGGPDIGNCIDPVNYLMECVRSIARYFNDPLEYNIHLCIRDFGSQILNFWELTGGVAIVSLEQYKWRQKILQFERLDNIKLKIFISGL